MRRPLQPLQPLQKTQLEPPVRSISGFAHAIRDSQPTNLSYRFPTFETSATACTILLKTEVIEQMNIIEHNVKVLLLWQGVRTNNRRKKVRKFRSQTSDKMDTWPRKSRGKSQRREEQKREEQRRERVRRKKMQVREKVAKSRSTGCFSNDLWLRRVEKSAR